MTEEDRSTRARIRDAAMDCYAQLGVSAVTARKVAEAAGVSPGSIIHHYGSMEGLRTACDQHVASRIRVEKRAAIGQSAKLDVLSAMQGSDASRLAGYLASVLHDDSPAVASLVDELVADAVGYLKEGQAAGTVREVDDLEATAAILTMWSLGAMVMRKHLQRLLDVDLTDLSAADPADLARYAAASMGALGEGIFTPQFLANLDLASTKATR